MITGKTSSGYKYSVDERLLTDFDFVTKLMAFQSKDPFEQSKTLVYLAEAVFGGPEGLEKYKEHIKKKNNGYCPVEIISKEITEILMSNKETKN